MPELVMERMRFAYQLSRGLTSIANLDELVKFATTRARELFEAEGSSLIMLDEQTREFYFPVVSDVDQWAQMKVGKLRFPADEGIAGWVLKNNQPVLVTDTATDPRFYKGIDAVTKMSTQAILCAPLRTAKGILGVIEIINPGKQFLTQRDVEFLDSIAGDVALACERAKLAEALRGDVDQLRRVLLYAGSIALAGALVLLTGWTMLSPEAASMMGPVAGIAALSGGVTLLGIGSGWFATSAAEPQ